MKNIVYLIAIVYLVTLPGCSTPRPDEPANGKSNARQNSSTATPARQDGPNKTAAAADPNRTLTLDQYNKLVVGMSRAEVEEIIGWPGIVGGGTEGDASTSVVWKTAGTESIIGIFKEGKLTQKMQFNLK